MLHVAIAHPSAHLRYGNAGFPKQAARLIHAYTRQVFIEALACFLFEQGAEIIHAETDGRAHAFQGERLGVVLLDIQLCVADGLQFPLLPFQRRLTQQSALRLLQPRPQLRQRIALHQLPLIGRIGFIRLVRSQIGNEQPPRVLRYGQRLPSPQPGIIGQLLQLLRRGVGPFRAEHVDGVQRRLRVAGLQVGFQHAAGRKLPLQQPPCAFDQPLLQSLAGVV